MKTVKKNHSASSTFRPMQIALAIIRMSNV